MLGLGTVLVVLLAAAPPSPDAIARAQRDVLDDASYQKSFDEKDRRSREEREAPARQARTEDDWEPVTTRDDPPARAETDGDATPTTRTNPPPRRSTGESEGSLNAVVWVAAGTVVLLLLIALVRAWRRSPAPDLAKPAAPKVRPKLSPQALQRPMTAAERLAADGRYAEAVHVLLLETLEALSAHTSHGLRASWTSREVLRQATMPEAAQRALGGLVKTVEQSLFGLRDVDKFDFARSLDAFTAFRDAYQGAPS